VALTGEIRGLLSVAEYAYTPELVRHVAPTTRMHHVLYTRSRTCRGDACGWLGTMSPAMRCPRQVWEFAGRCFAILRLAWKRRNSIVYFISKGRATSFVQARVTLRESARESHSPFSACEIRSINLFHLIDSVFLVIACSFSRSYLAKLLTNLILQSRIIEHRSDLSRVMSSKKYALRRTLLSAIILNERKRPTVFEPFLSSYCVVAQN